MKTTVELSDALLERAKTLARREGTTLRALVEEGLEEVLRRRRAKPTYELPDCSVGGDGLSPEYEGAGWAALREAAYAGRGG